VGEGLERWMSITCGATIAPLRGRGDYRQGSRGGFEGSSGAGVYSHEWGFAKLLHWLRHNPEKRGKFVTALEHCDMAAATLSGITTVSDLKRSVCAMGHKWMWNPKWGGLPPEEFWWRGPAVWRGAGEDWREFLTSDHIAGHLSPKWAEALGLAGGIPIPWGIRRALGRDWVELPRGRCGQRRRHVDVHYRHGAGGATGAGRLRGGAGERASGLHGIEAGLSATGTSLKPWRRAGTTVSALSEAWMPTRRADGAAAAELG